MAGYLEIVILLGLAMTILKGVQILQIAFAADPAKQQIAEVIGFAALGVAILVAVICFKLMLEQSASMAEIGQTFTP